MADSAVALSSSVSPSQVFGQVTLTGTVQPKFSGSGPLSCSITFSDGDGGTTLDPSPVNSSGTARGRRNPEVIRKNHSGRVPTDAPSGSYRKPERENPQQTPDRTFR